MHPLQQTPQPLQHYQVSPKSPGIALLVSFFFPGVGSMMNGSAGKGVLILGGYILSWVFVWTLIAIIPLVGFWIWGMVDAYQGAQRWNQAHGVIS
jgi:TM2 domain-containing membrane protein YozV